MTCPTPLQLLASKAEGRAITIKLPGGRQVLLCEYLRSWRKLKSLPPQNQVANWEWYPVSAGDILRGISAGIDDRISRHLPWFDTAHRYYAGNPPHSRRIERRRQKQLNQTAQ